MTRPGRPWWTLEGLGVGHDVGEKEKDKEDGAGRVAGGFLGGAAARGSPECLRWAASPDPNPVSHASPVLDHWGTVA